MTERQHVTEAVRRLQTCYPRLTLSRKTLDAYTDALSDVDQETLERVTGTLARTCTFFPSIAEILAAVAEEALSLPSVSEAWGSEHELVERARERVGNEWYWRTTNESALHSQLTRVYAEMRTEAIREYQRTGVSSCR